MVCGKNQKNEEIRDATSKIKAIDAANGVIAEEIMNDNSNTTVIVVMVVVVAVEIAVLLAVFFMERKKKHVDGIEKCIQELWRKKSRRRMPAATKAHSRITRRFAPKFMRHHRA